MGMQNSAVFERTMRIACSSTAPNSFLPAEFPVSVLSFLRHVSPSGPLLVPNQCPPHSFSLKQVSSTASLVFVFWVFLWLSRFLVPETANISLTGFLLPGCREASYQGTARVQLPLQHYPLLWCVTATPKMASLVDLGAKGRWDTESQLASFQISPDTGLLNLVTFFCPFILQIQPCLPSQFPRISVLPVALLWASLQEHFLSLIRWNLFNTRLLTQYLQLTTPLNSLRWLLLFGKSAFITKALKFFIESRIYTYRCSQTLSCENDSVHKHKPSAKFCFCL